jgi:hypothetical protein
MRNVLFVLVMLFGITPAHAVWNYSEAGPAVILLHVYGTLKEPLSTAPNTVDFHEWGTGFIVSPDGLVLSAGHMIPDKQLFDDNGFVIEAYYPQPDKSLLSAEAPPVELFVIKAMQKPHDIALLSIKDVSIPQRFLRLCDGFDISYSDFGVLGYARGRPLLSAQHGRVSTPAGTDLDMSLQLSLDPGNSGSPVFNELGMVFAVAVARSEVDGERLDNNTEVVSIEKAMELLAPEGNVLNGMSYDPDCKKILKPQISAELIKSAYTKPEIEIAARFGNKQKYAGVTGERDLFFIYDDKTDPVIPPPIGVIPPANGQLSDRAPPSIYNDKLSDWGSYSAVKNATKQPTWFPRDADFNEKLRYATSSGVPVGIPSVSSVQRISTTLKAPPGFRIQRINAAKLDFEAPSGFSFSGPFVENNGLTKGGQTQNFDWGRTILMESAPIITSKPVKANSTVSVWLEPEAQKTMTKPTVQVLTLPFSKTLDIHRPTTSTRKIFTEMIAAPEGYQFEEILDINQMSVKHSPSDGAIITVAADGSALEIKFSLESGSVNDPWNGWLDLLITTKLVSKKAP